MKLKLPKSVLDSLPAPDSEGLVRVTAAMKVDPDGNATIEELNDEPVPSSDEPETDDANPMPEADAAEALKTAPDSMY